MENDFSYVGENLTVRPLREGASLNEFLKPWDEINICIEITLHLLQTLTNLGYVLMLEGLVDAQVVVTPREVGCGTWFLTSTSRTCYGINSHILFQNVKIGSW